MRGLLVVMNIIILQLLAHSLQSVTRQVTLHDLILFSFVKAVHLDGHSHETEIKKLTIRLINSAIVKI